MPSRFLPSGCSSRDNETFVRAREQKPYAMSDPALTAYHVSAFPLKIIVATAERDWMTQTSASFANRCLPLRLANQFGWFILNDQTLEAVWSGGEGKNALTIRFPGGRKSMSATSYFGHGILTWHIPFLFRTSPGYNLIVRGPTNWPKDGAVALDGIVETDWAVATFTMNWKLTCVGIPVVFSENEPICMIAPIARGQLECFAPEIRQLDEDRELKAKFDTWSKSRDMFLEKLNKESDRTTLWQKHYFRGTSPSNDGSTEHQTRMRLRPFSDDTTVKGTEEMIALGDAGDPLRARRKAKALWEKIYGRITRKSQE